MTREPTTGEIGRILTEHIKNEGANFIRFEDKLDAILSQTTKTNGRVSSIESWKEKEAHPLLEDYKDNRSQAKGVGKLWTFFGAGVIAFVALTGTLYVNKIKSEILAEVRNQQ